MFVLTFTSGFEVENMTCTVVGVYSTLMNCKLAAEKHLDMLKNWNHNKNWRLRDWTDFNTCEVDCGDNYTAFYNVGTVKLDNMEFQ